MGKLLDAYNSRRTAYQKTFTCTVTGLVLRMEKPRYRDRRTAEALARSLWREQSGDQVVIAEYADLVRACLIGTCLYEQHATEPVGTDVLELDEHVLDHYDSILRSIENPPVEDIDDELLDEFVEELRGKSERVVQHLNVTAGSLLDRLLRYMACRLSDSATTTCSTSTSSTASSSKE